MRSIARVVAVGLLVGAALACGSDGDDGGGGRTTASSTSTSAGPPPAERSAFVFTFFRGGGGSGVFLAVSEDGLRFREVNGGEPVLRSSLGLGLTRDPSVLLDPDGGWHVAWTSGEARQVAMADSEDLLTWSEPRAVPVMEHEPSTVNAWAPELHWDEEGQRYALLYSSTVRRLHPQGTSEPGADGIPLEHRLYASYSTDLRDWSEGRLFWDRDLNVIDGAVVFDEEGDRYAMAYKDERLEPLQKNIRITFGPSFDGPWTLPDQLVDAVGIITEGPSLVRDRAGTGWLLYADHYAEGYYALASSPDLERWTERTDDLQLPEGARHGTVLRVPASSIEHLLAPAE